VRFFLAYTFIRFNLATDKDITTIVPLMQPLDKFVVKTEMEDKYVRKLFNKMQIVICQNHKVVAHGLLDTSEVAQLGRLKSPKLALKRVAYQSLVVACSRWKSN